MKVCSKSIERKDKDGVFTLCCNLQLEHKDECKNSPLPQGFRIMYYQGVWYGWTPSECKWWHKFLGHSHWRKHG